MSLIATLPACATTTATSVPTDKVACTAFGPRSWSPKDTDKTIAEAKEYNAAWRAICMAKAAKPKGATFKERWYGGEKIQVTDLR